MKKLYVVSLFLFFVIVSQAQDTLLANYPLTENGVDQTGNNDDMTLVNAVFENGGVFSNGIYYGNDTTGTIIQTPMINGFDASNFTVLLDFYIKTYPGFRQAIVIGGPSWRWLGAYMDVNKIALMANDLTTYEITQRSIELNSWNTLGISYSSATGKVSVFVNDGGVGEYDVPEISTSGDFAFVNSHNGNGSAFSGYWRNLRIYNTSFLAGINDRKTLEGVSVSTTSDLISINVSTTNRPLSAKLIDLNGRLIASEELVQGVNTFSVPSGNNIYLVEVADNQGRKLTKKIVAR